jgi:hypothetical protein
MARGTDFGGVHSYHDLHLVQALVEVAPAEPKLNFIDIPGADGAKDFSEAPAGRVVYNTRQITWTFKMYPTDEWTVKYMHVNNALNGRRCRITLDADPDYYYIGRLAVESQEAEGILHTITVTATCQPYKLKQSETIRTVQVNTTQQTISLLNEHKPAIPLIKVTAETTLGWNGGFITLAPGEHRSLDIELPAGVSKLTAKTVSGTGTLTLTYQEGAL